MLEYTKVIKIRDGVLGPGYLYFIDKEHSLANRDGAVYYHRHVVSLKIGRWLTAEEDVHHIDGDRVNNNSDNLEVSNRSEHAKLHAPDVEERTCPQCGTVFKPTRNRIRYCSQNCFHRSCRCFNVSREELEKLVWEMPTTRVAKVFGVSDKAIEKRCRKLGIKKPGRGYW